jgi:hypothetical protein
MASCTMYELEKSLSSLKNAACLDYMCNFMHVPSCIEASLQVTSETREGALT